MVKLVLWVYQAPWDFQVLQEPVLLARHVLKARLQRREDIPTENQLLLPKFINIIIIEGITTTGISMPWITWVVITMRMKIYRHHLLLQETMMMRTTRSDDGLLSTNRIRAAAPIATRRRMIMGLLIRRLLP